MLILKLSKNSTLADSIDPYEAEVLGQAIELLVEVMQGPRGGCVSAGLWNPGAEASHVPSLNQPFPHHPEAREMDGCSAGSCSRNRSNVEVLVDSANDLVDEARAAVMP